MWPRSPSRMEDDTHPDLHREPVVSVRAIYPPSSFGSLELTHIDSSLDPAASSDWPDLWSKSEFIYFSVHYFLCGCVFVESLCVG